MQSGFFVYSFHRQQQRLSLCCYKQHIFQPTTERSLGFHFASILFTSSFRMAIYCSNEKNAVKDTISREA
jgi:hypothetical protein